MHVRLLESEAADDTKSIITLPANKKLFEQYSTSVDG